MSYLQHMNVSTSPPEISGPCVFCQKEYLIPFASADDLNNSLTAYFIHNELMQEAFPQHSADQQEFMISGVCPDCWKSTFNSDSNSSDSDSEFKLLEETLRIVEDPETIYEEVDDFADIDDFEEDDYFLPTEFPPREEQ